MKRYGRIFDYAVESDNGDWVKFTDYQAEIAKRDELLRKCVQYAGHALPGSLKDTIEAILQ